MTGFDPDEYGGYDGEDDELYAVENAYSEADKTSRPIKILLDVYKKYQQKDPIADRVAEDSEAHQWLDDYWAYVCMVEHGNECSVEEVGGFVGFARSFSDYAPEIAEYLLYDDINEIDGDARGLYDRFIPIAQRYGGNVSKTDKLHEHAEKSIHDMIAQCRENNNSLRKSRVVVQSDDVKKDSYDDYEHYDNYADTSTLNDILYYAMACEEEMRSIEELDGEGQIAFKCDPEEYRRKIIECKQMCDWLTDNITVYRYR